MLNDWNAFKQGFNASKETNGDTAKAENPYPEGGLSWQSWNRGWNSHFEKDWEKEVKNET